MSFLSCNFLNVVHICNRNVLNQFLASLLCNLSVMAACSSFTWLEPLTLWFTSEESEIKMTTSDISWLSSSIEFGELIIGIPSGILADSWGRKPLILSIGPLGLLAWLLAIFTRNLPVLYVVRFLQGTILGISMSVCPTYIAEISSPNIRGALGGHTVVFIYIGFLYTYCTSYYLNYEGYLYIQAVVPLVFFLTFIFMPESPYYYFMKKKNDKAIKALSWLRNTDDVTKESEEIQQAVEEDLKRKSSKWKDLIATKSDRRSLLIVQIVNIAAYMTGVQSLSMFATETFTTTSLLWFTPKQVTVAMGVMLCLSALLASFVADTVGRRKLLLISSVGITISNLILAVYYFLAEQTKLNVGQVSWVMYIGLAGLCIFTNIGVGELVHTIQAEFFPSHTRSVGGGVTSAVASVAIFISVKIYQPIAEISGFYMNFIIYAIISFVTIIFIIFYVAESAGKTLAEVTKQVQEDAEGKVKETQIN